MNTERLKFLAQLPLLLNSSLQAETVVETALKHLRTQLEAEAATVFLIVPGTNELMFWASHGGQGAHLGGKRMPADKGIVGWVIQKREPLLVEDASQDPRFFSDIDRETDFQTKSVICVPLIVRGAKPIGAIQVLNKNDGSGFSSSDLEFVGKFGHQAALAINNAQLFREAQRHAKQLAVLSRRKDEMISVITHEFQTPLNIFHNSLELVTSGQLPQEDRERISQTLYNALERLTSLIKRTRDVALLSGGSTKIRTENVSLPAVFEALATEFSNVFKERDLEFSSTIEQDLPKAEADYTLLLVALRNLISNAIRFTPNGGQISLEAKRTMGLVEVCVTDTGIGIDEAEKELIFEKFYEVTDVLQHSSGTYQFKSCGLGLGLPTVKAIVEAHGSSVRVKSTPEQGSSFSFSLRIAQ